MIGSLIVGLAAAAQPATAQEYVFERAQARDLRSGKLLYEELHWLSREQDRLLERLVVYQCANGTSFARKRVDYRPSSVAPGFILEDYRHRYSEGLRYRAAPELWFKQNAALEQTHRTPVGQSLVADAGFDEWIRQHWAALSQGQTKSFDFMVPARQGTVSLKVQRRGSPTINGEPALELSVSADYWFAFLLPKLRVAYSVEDQRLLRFEGLSSLMTDRGDEQARVRIDFVERREQVSAQDMVRWQSTDLQSCAIGS